MRIAFPSNADAAGLGTGLGEHRAGKHVWVTVKNRKWYFRGKEGGG